MSRDHNRSAPPQQAPPELVSALLNAYSSPAFERFTRLATRLTGVPITMLGFVHGDQMQLLAAHGTSELIQPHSSIPRAQCFCQTVVEQQQPLSVPDTEDSEVGRNCWIVARTGMRSLLAVPVTLSGGVTFGCLAVADVAPRAWSPEDIASLEDLAILVADEFERQLPLDPAILSESAVQRDQTSKERLLDAIGEGIYAVDGDGYCQFINRAGANMLGYDPEQMLGQQMHQLVHHSYPDGTPMPRSECTVVQAMLDGDALNVSEQVFWRRDGSPVRVELTVSPVIDQGEVTGTVVRFSAVSERQRQQELLRQSEVRKSAMFEAALDCIISIDHTGRVIEFNSAAERTFGYSREHAIGSMMADLIMPAEFRELCLESFWEHLQTGESSMLGQRVERPAMRADGSIIETEMSVTRIDLPGQAQPIFTAYLRDITGRRAAEREIHRFQHMVDSVGQVVIANDNTPERLITYWNKSAEKVLGWRSEEVVGKRFYDIVPAPDFQPDVQTIGARVRQGQTWHGEFWMRHRDGRTIPALASVSPIFNDDGELLGVVGAFSDITDIKDAEREIRLYKHIVDAVGESVVASDMDRKIFYANRAAEQALGWSIDDVRGKDIRDVIPAPEYRDQSTWIGTEVRSRAETISAEFELQRVNGEIFPALVNLAPIVGDDSELVGTIGIYTDITDLKKTEREIRLYKHMTDAVGQALVGNDLDRTITYWNRAAEDMMGWAAEEVIGRKFIDVVPPDEAKPQVQEIGRFVREGKSWSGEFQLKRKSGEIFPVLLSVSPVLDDDGNAIQIIGAYTDISELRQREKDVQFFKDIVAAIGEAVVSTDWDGKIRYINSAAEEILGWTSEELLGRPLVETILDPEHLDRGRNIASHVRKGNTFSGEFGLIRKDGRKFPSLISVAPVTNEAGEINSIISVFRDITDLKQALDENRFFKNVVDAVGQVVIAHDLERNITYWNRAAEQILDRRAEDVLGIDALSVGPTPHFLDSMLEISAQVRHGKTWTGEFPLQHRDGREIPALSTMNPILDEDGEIIGVLGVHTDIREIKRTEEDLRFHKHIVDAVGQAVVVSDSAGCITYWNKAAEEIYGWAPEEAIGSLVYNLLPVESDRDRAIDVTRNVSSGQIWSGETRVRHRNGTEFPAYFTVSPIRDSSDDIVGIIGVSHDISDRKEYERQIEFHRIMLDAVGQTIVTTDTNRVITYWSRGAEHALGWTAEEVLGRPIAEIAPAVNLKEEAAELHRKVRSGETWTGEFPIRRKDGSLFPAVVSLAPVTLADQGVVGVIGVYTDVSELKETEAELRLHKHMLDAVGQAVCATDETLTITYWNQSAEELYGYPAAEAIGQKLLNFLPPGSPGLMQAVEAIEIVSREGDWTGEMFTYHKDGTEIAALVSISPILGEHGRQSGLIVSIADISARRKIEQALQESNEQITEILETMGDGFVSLTRDWTITYVNRQVEHISGAHRDDLLGKDFWEMFPDPPELPFYRAFDLAFETGEPVDITDYDPQLGMWLEVHATPSRDQLSVFVRDVTERREREIALREAEERFRSLVEQLPAVTYIADPDDIGKLSYVSPQVESVFGYTHAEWLSDGSFAQEIVHPDDRAYVISEDEKTNAGQRDRFVMEYRLRAADGAYRWVRDVATLIHSAEGTPLYWQGLSYDITDEKRSERIIRESEQRFRSLFDNHPDAVFSIDHTGYVLSANPKFEELSGVSARQPGLVKFVDLVVPEDQERVAERFVETHRGIPQDFRAGMFDPHGKRLELSLTTIPISVDEDIVGVHVVAQDITLHQELENQLAHQAYHDALTGLPNRNLFQSRLDERLEQSRVDESRFAVLFFDLDDFKVINDSLGHSAGDQLLIEVASRVQTCIRSNDLLARLGGDEFTLLLESIDDEHEPRLIAKRIAEVLEDSFDIEDHEVFATTSVGIAIADGSAPGSDDVLRNADLAMYEAKNSGKNRFALFEPSMNSRAWRRLTLETEIRRGIPRDEFEVYYQPIVDLGTGELVGVEALARWNHPDRGFLTPNEFISVAEQSGLILPLGRWIIREATAQLREWQYLMPDGQPLRLSLNLSPKQYQHPNLIEELTRTLKSVDFDPSLITLEITESIAMDDSPETMETLQQLKDVGVQLALDDFGTGFSALSYLRRFPIDIIKIDQSFVDGLGEDSEDSRIVRAVMAASLAMNLHVTAEGVETRKQLDILRELGCHFGQGYLFARALTSEEMQRIIAEGNHSWQALISPGPQNDETNT